MSTWDLPVSKYKYLYRYFRRQYLYSRTLKRNTQLLEAQMRLLACFPEGHKARDEVKVELRKMITTCELLRGAIGS